MAELEPTDIRATSFDETVAQRNALLKDKKIDYKVIRKAWFTMSHLLLADGAHVVDMGCGDGEVTFVMAVLNPHLQFTGLDKNKRNINKAKSRFELDNLDFKIGDTSSQVFGKDSLDAIINSYVLHEVYSNSRYSEKIVSDTLEAHHMMLKKDGQIMIRDYARPPPEEFVLMEIPDLPSKSDELKDLSEADLLVWYSEHARPKNDPGCGGFFIEELPAQFPKTRLFRLPYKWAYEYIMRKDDRSHWETELPVEYTFFTKREMRRSLSSLGMRVQYAAPHWDEDIIRESFEGKFRLYSDDGTPMDYPPVCYITIAKKLADRKSLQILERRPSQSKEESKISIKAMRNNKTGQLVDVARSQTDVSEVLPYRIDKTSHRLKVFLHEGLARSITNAVPRSGANLGDQRWSGHMIEAISVESGDIPAREDINFKQSALFARDYLGLKPEGMAELEIGQDYYPSPDFIEEKIQTYYLEVSETKRAIKPLKTLLSARRFQAKGNLAEFDAQQILDAISVGMIPNARLELQILALFSRTKIKPENWTKKHMAIEMQEVMNNQSLRDAINNLKLMDNVFSDVKGSANDLRRVHSVFVEEGQSQGARAGLSYEDVDFIVHNHETINVAIVLPLTKDHKNLVHAAVNLEQMPAAQRFTGPKATLSAPRINFPPEVTNLRLAKKHLAKHFGVLPDNVIKMGEPYFTHIGITPQKIHPFAVVVPHDTLKDPTSVSMPFYQLALINMDQKFVKSQHCMTLIGRSFRHLNDELKFDAKASSKYIANQQFTYDRPNFIMPLEYHRGPSLSDEPEIAPVINKTLDAKAVKPSKIVTLKEDIAPSFDAPEPSTAKTEEPKVSTVDKVKGMIKPLLPKAKPEEAPDMAHDFEREIEAFIEEIQEIDQAHAPRPEKW